MSDLVSDSSSSSSSDEESIEWEEVETPLGPVTDSITNSKDDIQISLEKSAKKKTSAVELAQRARLRKLQETLHKVHLLCLISNGQYLISQCDNMLHQSIVLSLTPVNLALSTPSELSGGEKTLLFLLRWFVTNKSVYNKSDSSHILKELSDVQLLVTLCKSLGLRTRLVLVLNPLSLKPSLKKTTPSSPCLSKKDSSFKQYEHKPIMTKRQSKRKRQDEDEEVTSPYFDKTPSKKKIKLEKDEIKEEEEEEEEESSEQSSSYYYNSVTSWVEVMLTNGKWKSLHIPSVSVGQPVLCEKHANTKLLYVLGYEHYDVFRDLTPRYSSQWCINKERVDKNWWSVTLSYSSFDSREQEQEDQDIKEQLLSRPLPSVISHYKNHPLYALKKQLLTYEIIHPPDSHVLGHFKGEPVYSRDNVYTLHTRETWLKEGLVIKEGEQPCKVVKARRRKSNIDSHNNTTQLFGRWQTKLFIPDPVINGQVPKNEYGNIEIFTSSMIPEGAVHLTEGGIGKIARKLSIDYAPAMRGWEFNKGTCYPVIDGIVVAKEYEDILLEAWQQEEQLSIEKSIKKHQSIVHERWTRLTRGILIHERVKQRYRNTYTTTDNNNCTKKNNI